MTKKSNFHHDFHQHYCRAKGVLAPRARTKILSSAAIFWMKEHIKKKTVRMLDRSKAC